MENQSSRRQEEEERQPERKRQRLEEEREQKRQEKERKQQEEKRQEKETKQQEKKRQQKEKRQNDKLRQEGIKQYVRELEEKLKQEILPQLQEELKQQLEEEKQLQQYETKKETIERHAGKLLEEWKLQIIPQQQQQQQAKKISELTLEQHDQLLSFILFTNDRNDRMLGYKVCNKLRIVDIIDSMDSFVCQKYKMKIKEIGEKNGNFAATERFMLLATLKKLKIGWSRQLIQVVTAMKLKDVENLISPKQADLEEFNKQNGIPRGSLLDQLTDKLRTHCGILISPMGKNDKDSESVPVVHPEMVISENHFRKNTAFTDGTYKPLEEGRKAYKDAPRISFNDVINLNFIEAAFNGVSQAIPLVFNIAANLIAFLAAVNGYP